ncbi:MAG: RNA-directed DNA polymerase, partial [Hymenobacter sp.]
MVNEEVDRLLKSGLIREVKYPDWLANTVVVKKKNGKWRVCVDYTDLNKACPKDSFPLPHIERLVEATACHKVLSFMDAFSGYNQILMHPNDQEKTAFTTDKGIYCYKVMPFGLKNAGATYQRLVNKMFADKIGTTMEVYIDDMSVKSLRETDHVSHLEECFKVLNSYQMKLNPSKCTFGVSSGKFCGYMVTQRGIEANPNKIQALKNLPSPRNKREIQRLTGRVAALSRFISRSTDKCLPFYKLLRGNKKFEWTEKCEEAFEQLKQYLAEPLTLAKPEVGETLYLYVAVSHTAVSGVLVREERGDQKPVFY